MKMNLTEAKQIADNFNQYKDGQLMDARAKLITVLAKQNYTENMQVETERRIQNIRTELKRRRNLEE